MGKFVQLYAKMAASGRCESCVRPRQKTWLGLGGAYHQHVLQRYHRLTLNLHPSSLPSCLDPSLPTINGVVDLAVRVRALDPLFAHG